MRGELARFLYVSYDWLVRYQSPCYGHYMFWGVYCGPTLTMVHPKPLLGLKALLEGDE